MSTTYKQSPFTVVQKNGNSVLVVADGVQYRRNVNHVKKNLERAEPQVNHQIPQRLEE